jgi:hypothetical protein
MMNYIKTAFTLLLLMIIVVCNAQTNTYSMSNPLDIPQTGWNKVLCMKNGNTLLLHFETGKKIQVKVFDSTHKETGSRIDACKVLDILKIADARFKGLFEVNGEAVLFIDQDHGSKHGLVRVRFGAVHGNIIGEDLAWESHSENKQTIFFVMKNKEDDNYEVVYCTDVRHPAKHNETLVRYYNNKHGIIKDVPLEVDDRTKYDYCNVVGAEAQPNGILVTMSLETIVINGTLNRGKSYTPSGAIYDHNLHFFYIPKGNNNPVTRLVNVGNAVFPNYCIYTYNQFAQASNLLLYSYKPVVDRFGLNLVTGGLSRNIFFKIDTQEKTVGLNLIKNAEATKYLGAQTGDTTKIFVGVPAKLFTNENGLSTLVSQSFDQYGGLETRVRYNHEMYYGKICITQFDDNGNEIWGKVLPLAQYFKSYKHDYDYRSKDVSMRWQDEIIFGDLPEQCTTGNSILLILTTTIKIFS